MLSLSPRNSIPVAPPNILVLLKLKLFRANSLWSTDFRIYSTEIFFDLKCYIWADKLVLEKREEIIFS